MQNATASLLKASTRAKSNPRLFVNRGKQALREPSLPLAPPPSRPPFCANAVCPELLEPQILGTRLFWAATGKAELTEGIF